MVFGNPNKDWDKKVKKEHKNTEREIELLLTLENSVKGMKGLNKEREAERVK